MAASIFNGTAVKILKNILRFKDGTELSSTTASNLSTITSNVQDQIDDKVNRSGDTMTGTLNLPTDGLTVGTDQLVVSGNRVSTNRIFDIKVNQVGSAYQTWDNGNCNLFQGIDGPGFFNTVPDQPLIATTNGPRINVYVGGAVRFYIEDTHLSAQNLQLRNLADPTSAQHAATQNYVDNAIAAIPAPLTFKGNWDASTNTPTLANTDTGKNGWLYKVNGAGTVDFGAGPISFSVGDYVVNDGSIWDKFDFTDAVLSVNGQMGVVVLTTADIAEVTNLYFTDERAQDAVGTILTDSATIDFTYNDATPSITAVVTPASLSDTHIASGAAIDATKLGLGTVSNTELDRLDGVTGNVQTQLDGKEPTITTLSIAKGGTNSGAALSNNRVMQSSGGAIVEAAAITAARALISDANGIPTQSTVTSTTLAFLDATSSVQTQIDGKQPLWQTLAISSDVTLTANRIHLVDTSAARALTLPAVANNLVLHVKDSSGSAETNNITITPASGTIDGASSLVINSAYGGAYLVSNGTNWFVI